MDFNFISKAFLATLGGVPVTLLIMVVSILLSFFSSPLFGTRSDLQGQRGSQFLSGLLSLYSRDASDSLDSLLL